MVTLQWETARKAPGTFCQYTTETLLQQPSVPGAHKTRRWMGTLLKDMHKIIRGKTGRVRSQRNLCNLHSCKRSRREDRT